MLLKLNIEHRKMRFWDTKELFQTLPFYNVLIEKPKLKYLSNIEL